MPGCATSWKAKSWISIPGLRKDLVQSSPHQLGCSGLPRLSGSPSEGSLRGFILSASLGQRVIPDSRHLSVLGNGRPAGADEGRWRGAPPAPSGVTRHLGVMYWALRGLSLRLSRMEKPRPRANSSMRRSASTERKSRSPPCSAPPGVLRPRLSAATLYENGAAPLAMLLSQPPSMPPSKFASMRSVSNSAPSRSKAIVLNACIRGRTRIPVLRCRALGALRGQHVRRNFRRTPWA